jgi:hypothetical protein
LADSRDSRANWPMLSRVMAGSLVSGRVPGRC